MSNGCLTVTDVVLYEEKRDMFFGVAKMLAVIIFSTEITNQGYVLYI